LLANITVTSLSDNLTIDGHVTLREAVLAGELDASVDGSETGSGPDTITFAPNLSGAIELSELADTAIGPTALLISSPITIEGNLNGITIERAAASELRLFRVVVGGSLTLESINIAGGIARGAAGTEIAPDGGAGLGGAIYNQGAVEIVASTLYDHDAIGGAAAPGGNGGSGRGGAIYNDGGSVVIVNSTLSSNSALTGSGPAILASFGAGVYNRNGTLEIYNSTITNSTATSGRGVFAIGDGGSAALTLYSSIVAQSDSVLTTDLIATTDGGGEISVAGNHNLIRRQNDFDFLADVDLRVDPMLGPLLGNGGPTLTHALGADNPALNQGSNPLNLTTDQRGGSHARVIGGQPDIGAYERQSVVLPELLGDYNGNQVVDAADYVVWRSTRETTVEPYSGADGDGDGHIDDDDYGVWAANFGKEIGPPAAPVVMAERGEFLPLRPIANFANEFRSELPVAEPRANRLEKHSSISNVSPALDRDLLELALTCVLDRQHSSADGEFLLPRLVARHDAEIEAWIVDDLLADWPASF
jgi:hypothetical protein